MDRPTLAYPWTRYNLFTTVFQLLLLKSDLERGMDPLNYYDLTELMCMLDDFLPSGAHEAIGQVLYDLDEAAAFAALLDLPVDGQTFYLPWPDQIDYVRSAEFQAILTQAERCHDIMLSAGRGIPGWNDADRLLAT